MANIRIDRSTGATVYDPSGEPNEADQGNAMQALARAMGFYNEASDLGTAANFGSPQTAGSMLAALQQADQAAKDRQNKLNLMAMQQSGAAAIAEAQMRQAALNRLAQQDYQRWAKQGDWSRYDRQMENARTMAQENKQALLDRSREEMAGRKDVANIMAGGREAQNTDRTRTALLGQLTRALQQPAPKDPNELMTAGSVIKELQAAQDAAKPGKRVTMDQAVQYVRQRNIMAHKKEVLNNVAPIVARLQEMGMDVSGLIQGYNPQMSIGAQDVNSPAEPNSPAQSGEPTPWQTSKAQFRQNLGNVPQDTINFLWNTNPAGAGLNLWDKTWKMMRPAMFPNEYGTPSIDYGE